MDRLHDIEETSTEMTKILNDPLVYPWLEGPPYPFLPEHGEDWIKLQCKESAPVLSQLQQEYEQSKNQTQSKDSEDTDVPKEFFDVCAFRCIREVTEYDLGTGAALKDVYIGSVSIVRYPFYEFAYGSAERAEAQARNNEIPAGDKDIVWGLGCMVFTQRLLSSRITNNIDRLYLFETPGPGSDDACCADFNPGVGYSSDESWYFESQLSCWKYGQCESYG
jgi:hypothetical protein